MGFAWQSLDFWDAWKAFSIGLTGLFGVMGLLTNYKDKETGRITAWGVTNLAGIMLSATMGIASQLYASHNEAISSARSAKEAQALAAVAATAASRANVAANEASAAAKNSRRLIADVLQVSKDTERSVVNSRDAAEAGQKAASATLLVARDTEQAVDTSKAGLLRIEKLLSPFREPTLHLGLLPKLSGDMICPEASSVDLKVQMYVVNQDGGTGIGYKPAIGRMARIEGSDCYYVLELPLTIGANVGGIVSYLDLPGRTLTIFLEGPAILRRISKASLYGLRIQTPDGQFVTIEPKDASIQTTQTGASIEYAFPLGRDPRTLKE